MPPFRALIFVAALLPLAAQGATWQWRDANGRMVYSDQPPPPEVRPAQIIRAPAPVTAGAASASDSASAAGGQGAQSAAADAAPAGAAAARGNQAAASTGSATRQAAAEAAGGAAKASEEHFQSWADREMAFRKRMAERQEAEQKQREEQEQAAKLARACDDARGSLRTLESGRRIVTLAADGEQVTMDDAERARRIEDGRRDLARHCGTG